MILSFGDRATEDLYHGESSKRTLRFSADVAAAALRKLDMLNAAAELADLKAPPGNRLEALKGRWKGFHSIRVNDQWRVVFKWRDGNPAEVHVVDYHG
jgi:proteic killer suppression protein